jgi:hypothetical protein
MKCISKKSKRYVGGVVFLLVLGLGGLTAAQICIQPPDGLVSWWPGEGNAKDIQSLTHPLRSSKDTHERASARHDRGATSRRAA